jgi:hypothetical protein
MRKIGTLTPIWNQELFIKPHFDLLSQLDRNVVLMQSGPLPQYYQEHGYSRKPDMSEALLEMYFPKVEIYPGAYPTNMDFASGLYNEGLAMMEDCDIVLRLDPDMLWTDTDWKAFINLLYSTDFDCYKMDFANDSINYYMTGDFNHGLKDAQEFDSLAVDPKKQFTGVLDYPSVNPTIIKLPDWMCHHFRGWQKPKSTPPDWANKLPKEYIEKYGDKGEWFQCPEEIKETMMNWMEELQELKEPVE